MAQSSALDLPWDVIGNASTALGVFIALVGVVASLVLTRRSEKLTRQGQELEREQAVSAAARSEAAAGLTEEYTRRVVLALETLAQEGLHADSSSRPQGVVWSLTHYAGDTYQLTNVGDNTATDVEVTADPSLHMRQPEEQALAAGEALTFMATRSMATTDSTITVRWTEQDDEIKTWRYPLPARPPRQRRK